MNTPAGPATRAGNPSGIRALTGWVASRLDSDRTAARRAMPESLRGVGSDPIDWPRIGPFVLLHLGCLGVLWVGVSPVAVWTALGLYALRMVAITGFYHRYFSHRAFKTSRPVQLGLAILGNTAVQRGPLWWAAHHRVHHKHSDRDRDVHSPHTRSLLWSHMGWFLGRSNLATDYQQIRDFARYPELRWLNRFDMVVPAALAVLLFGVGWILEGVAPGLGTDRWQMLVWGFCISTVALFHCTSAINSVAHLFGRKRYPTRDHSRNSFLLALLTFGEGWHNNHHHYPVSARQGFRWWEIDLTYYVLKAMAWSGLIWDLRPVPGKLRGRAAQGA